MDLECAADVGRLLDTLPEYSARDRAVLKQRVVSVLDCAEKMADRTETWDTAFFTAGFAASLVVTVATAVNLAKFMSPTATETLSAVILVISSVGTAALALRERLKFKETALLNRRTSSAMQRAVFLFMARAGPYASPDPGKRFADFVQDVEAIKTSADQAHLRIRNLEDTGGGGGAAVAVPTSTPTPIPPPQHIPPVDNVDHVNETDMRISV